MDQPAQDNAAAPVEFQAIILAGGAGNRLYPLTDGIAKPLLPVANRPLLAFQLELLERSGKFAECIVVTVQPIARAVTKYINEFHPKGPMAIQIAVLDNYMGTADALRKIRDRIRTDFIVISGDLITDVFIHYLADIHRSRDASLTMLLKETPQQSDEKKGNDDSIGLQYIGLADKSNRVVYFKAGADVEDAFTVKKYLLRRHPDLTIHTKLKDAHLYIFSHWVLDLLMEKSHMSSIQGELVPYLVLMQFSPLASKYMSGSASGIVQQTRSMQMSHSETPEGSLGCYAYVAPETSYMERANTIPTYLAMNRDLPLLPVSESTPWSPVWNGNFLDEAVAANPKAQLGQNLIGQGLKMGPNGTCTVKKSTIGKYCKIGDQVKITNSIIMDYVTIEDRCVITNSIVCNNASISANCTITDAQIGAGYQLPSNTTVKNDALSTSRS